MIRRLLAIAVLAFAGVLLSAAPAGADNGNILCVYNKETPRFGLCIGVPW